MTTWMAAAAALVLGTLSPTTAAVAHETRAAGPVQLVVGWQDEPPLAGVRNAVEVAARPVPAPEDRMSVEVTFGDRRMVFPLEADPGSPGVHRAAVIPTRPGNYGFRVTGTVRGQAIDQSFTSGPDTFDPVREAADIQFPDEAPSAAVLASAVERLGPRTAAAASRAGRSDAAAGQARLIGLAALVVAVVGLVIGVGGRRRTAPG